MPASDFFECMLYELATLRGNAAPQDPETILTKFMAIKTAQNAMVK